MCIITDTYYYYKHPVGVDEWKTILNAKFNIVDSAWAGLGYNGGLRVIEDICNSILNKYRS